MQDLKDYIGNKKNYQLKLVLNRFYSLREKQNNLKKYFKLLNHTTLGGAIDAFNKWKAIPESKENMRKASKFELCLMKLLSKSIKVPFEQFKDINY